MRYWVTGILIYLAALVFLAPAQLMGWLAGTLTDGRVAMTGLSGSFWAGGARRLSLQLPGGAGLNLNDVSWRIAPMRVVLGGAPLHLDNRSGDLVFSSDIRPVDGGALFTDLSARGRLDIMAPFLKGGVAEGLSGDFNLGGKEVRFGSDKRGQLDAEIRVAAGRIPTGTYSLAMTGEGGRFAIRWSGPKGPKAMSGGGWWDNSLHLDGVPGSVTR